MLENLVAVELKRRGKEVYYYKANDREVDFVVKKEKYVEELIQSSYNITEYGVKEREIQALLKASKELKCKNLTVITWDYEDEQKIKNKKIVFKPLWKWLLV